MFKKLKLKSYLFTVFATIIAFVAILTVLSVTGLLVTKNKMSDYIDNTIGADTAVKICRVEANIAARNVREMALTENVSDYNKLKDQVYESQAKINEQIAVFKSTHGEADGLAKKYEDSFNTWFQIAEKVIGQLDSGDKKGATATILHECSPALSNLVSIVGEIDETTSAEKLSEEKKTENIITLFILIFVAIFVVVLVASIMFAIRTTLNLVKTTGMIKDAVVELSKGNLNAHVDYEAHNEFGELAEYVNFSCKELKKYVDAIGFGMTQFEKGDFTCTCPVQFLGDFEHIQTSVEAFQRRINETLVELETASMQVSDGADQVAQGAQSLAQGATEQASSVEELSASMEVVSEKIKQTTEYATNANELGQHAGEVVQKSQAEMKQMLQAIKDIATASENIQKIIKAIDDIAFQTNILALNAAVEAARAGSAGKGFAVVADEVRNLAQKSAEAARSTTELIDNSLERVAHGERLATSTDAAFDEVAQNAQEILGMVDKIANASAEQSTSIAQITQGVEQISAVVQMNSATSQESAASSEELSSQANVMKDRINQFQLDRGVHEGMQMEESRE